MMSEFKNACGLALWPSGVENKRDVSAEHIFAFIPALKYSDTSANEDNSFRNHIL